MIDEAKKLEAVQKIAEKQKEFEEKVTKKIDEYINKLIKLTDFVNDNLEDGDCETMNENFLTRAQEKANLYIKKILKIIDDIKEWVARQISYITAWVLDRTNEIQYAFDVAKRNFNISIFVKTLTLLGVDKDEAQKAAEDAFPEVKKKKSVLKALRESYEQEEKEKSKETSNIAEGVGLNEFKSSGEQGIEEIEREETEEDSDYIINSEYGSSAEADKAEAEKEAQFEKDAEVAREAQKKREEEEKRAQEAAEAEREVQSQVQMARSAGNSAGESAVTYVKTGIQKGSKRNPDKIDEIYVHCAATPEGKHFEVSDIIKWHLERGFSTIGYHYVVLLDGTIQKGRDELFSGAHCKGRNSRSVGVCYIGGCKNAKGLPPKDTRTPAQKSALKSLLKELKSKYPKAKIMGHRDCPSPKVSKACPSFDAKREYANI